MIVMLMLACLGAPLTRPTPLSRNRLDPRLIAALNADPAGRRTVWVFFSDRGFATDAQRTDALEQAADGLPTRCLARRTLRRTAKGLVDDRDLPPAARYVSAVTRTGAQIRRPSRWLNAVSVVADADQIRSIARLPFVRRLQRVAPMRVPRPIADDAGAHDAGDASVGGFLPSGDPSETYNFSFNQLNQIGVVEAHLAGYTGSGVVIGILDTGFKRTHVSINQTTPPAHPVIVLDEYDFINDDDIAAPEGTDPASQHFHGTQVLGTLAAYHPSVLMGAAYDASYLLAKTEDITQEVQAEEDQFVAGLEWLELNGVDVVTSSLGYIDWYTSADLDGATAVTTIAVNIATANGVICCNAAGNSGHDSDPATLRLIAPADAFDVITCGSVTSTGATSGFSSDGPAFDGRVKPEVLARGSATSTISPGMSDTLIPSLSGTSFSTPLVAGGVALIVQAHPDWSVSKVRRALLHTADGFSASGAFDAAFVRGYGIVNIMDAIQFVHADINGDGLADGDDVEAFLLSVSGLNRNDDQNRRADLNADGVVTAADVPIFISDLLGN